MNSKKIVLGATVLTIAASALMLTGNTFAYQGDYTQKGPDCDSEKHEAMEQAFENSDYQAWKELMNGKGRASEVVNEGNFVQFAEAHKLAEEGNYEGADEIRKELGLRTRDGERMGAGYGKGNGEGNGEGRFGRNSQ
jgi:hypothetical protein